MLHNTFNSRQKTENLLLTFSLLMSTFHQESIKVFELTFLSLHDLLYLQFFCFWFSEFRLKRFPYFSIYEYFL